MNRWNLVSGEAPYSLACLFIDSLIKNANFASIYIDIYNLLIHVY